MTRSGARADCVGGRDTKPADRCCSYVRTNWRHRRGTRVPTAACCDEGHEPCHGAGHGRHVEGGPRARSAMGGTGRHRDVAVAVAATVAVAVAAGVAVDAGRSGVVRDGPHGAGQGRQRGDTVGPCVGCRHLTPPRRCCVVIPTPCDAHARVRSASAATRGHSHALVGDHSTITPTSIIHWAHCAGRVPAGAARRDSARRPFGRRTAADCARMPLPSRPRYR